MYVAYFNEKKLWVPLIPQVSFDTARFTVWVRVYPRWVTVCAGLGTVWENPTCGIPVLNANDNTTCVGSCQQHVLNASCGYGLVTSLTICTGT